MFHLRDGSRLDQLPEFLPAFGGEFVQVQAQLLGQVVTRGGYISRQWAQVKVVEQGFGSGCLSIRNAVCFGDLETLL